MATPTGTVGAKIYTSLTALTNTGAAADAIGDFQALTITTEIGLIQNFGEFGRQFDPVLVPEVATGRTHKLKGGFNEGQMILTVSQDLSDTGQSTLKGYAEAANQSTYPFKITLLGADANNDTIYFGAKVTGFRTQMGGTNDPIRSVITLEIDTPIFTGAS